MSESRRAGEPSERDDRAFVESLAKHYAPPPMSAARRDAFDAAVGARIARRRQMLRPVPILAMAVVVVAWFAVPAAWRGGSGRPGEVGELTSGESGDVARWEAELCFAREIDAAEAGDGSEQLPDDYLAIASLIVGS